MKHVSLWEERIDHETRVIYGNSVLIIKHVSLWEDWTWNTRN